MRPVELPENRSLQSLGQQQQQQTKSSTECATAKEIREYLQDKSIVVYSSRSFVKEDSESGKNELVTFLEPVADKRLDFKYHKRVEAVI